MAPHDWNAADYDRTNAGVIALGIEVLDRLELRGDETVLDAGAGTGAVSAELARRLPDGHVVALDAAPQMVEFARRRFAATANVSVVHGDLAKLDRTLLEHTLPDGVGRVDAVFSTATFHWVKDHERLWANLRGVLVDGGALVAQCGGRGNIAGVEREYLRVGAEAPFAERLAGWSPHHFAGPQETERLMAAAGFASTRAWLQPRPVRPEDLGKHLREVILGAHAERLPPDLFERFASDVELALGERDEVDYVRLNIDAVA
jgi:trans-aconitate 2-methyltransferase